MKQIKWLFVILASVCVAAALGSCNSHKKAVSNHSSERETIVSDSTIEQIHIADIRESLRDALVNQSSFSNSVIIIYDTDKPVDSITGKPPVLAEIHSSSGTTSSSEIHEQQTETTVVSDSIISGSTTVISEKENDSQTEEQTKKIPWYERIANFVIIFGFLAVPTLIARFIWKNII